MAGRYPRFILITLMSFLSGLPLMLTNTALQAWATSKGLNLMAIGSLTLVSQPYAYKFLWAPLLDRYRIRPWRGLRRSWIMTMSLLLAISIACLSFSHLPNHLAWFIIFAFLIAFFSATMDIAIDAYRIEYLAEDEYALGNACYVSAYRMAMLVSGGLALIIAAYLGWQNTYLVMALLVLLCSMVIYFAPEPIDDSQRKLPVKWSESIIDPLKDLLNKPYIALLLLFIVLYKLGEGLGTSLASAFLIRHLHYSLAIVGAVYKTAGLIATIIGSFLGGMLYPYWKMYRSLLFFGILQALGVLLYIVLAEKSAQNIPLMVSTVAVEAGTAAMSTTVFVAFLMDLCTPEFTASQFALLTALPALDRVYTGPLASWLTEKWGWSYYFLISFLVCWPALFLLMACKRYIGHNHGWFRQNVYS